MEFIHRVKGIVVLAPDHNNNLARVFAKYYAAEFSRQDKQDKLEVTLASKSKKPEESDAAKSDAAEIVLIDQIAVVFRTAGDLHLFVIGSAEENEVVLLSVLDCFRMSLETLLSENLEKRNVLENYEALVLVADEMFDDGVIMQISHESVVEVVQPHMGHNSDVGTRTFNRFRRMLNNQNL